MFYSVVTRIYKHISELDRFFEKFMKIFDIKFSFMYL